MEEIVKGYILRAVPYRENHLIVDLLTADGLVSFKARGALKSPSKSLSAVQLYNYGEYQLYAPREGANKTLVAAEVKERLPSLFSDLQVHVLLALLTETIYKNKESENWYDVFTFFFQKLKEKRNLNAVFLVLLKYNTIYAGSYLGADGCLVCGTSKDIVSVSFQDGGFLCATCCEKLRRYRQDALYLQNFRYVVKANYQQAFTFEVPSAVAKSLASDFFKHLENNCGLTFKCRELVEDCL
ncbi:DNA repair protein RecO [bacterium]|nr:DNA repair protein RecO [bacterium]